MATHNTSSSNQSDILATPYLSSQNIGPAHESSYLHENVMYLNEASRAASVSELLSRNSVSSQNCVKVPSIEARDEVVFIPSTSDPMSTQSNGSQLNVKPGVSLQDSVIRESQMFSELTNTSLDAKQNMQYQELSLSLGMQIPSSIRLPSVQYHYADIGSSYLLSSDVPDSREHGLQSQDLRDAEYMSFDSAGGTRNTMKVGDFSNPQCLIDHDDLPSVSHLYELSRLSCTIFNCKYIKAAQELLDEVVNVHEALKQQKLDKRHNFHKLGQNISEETGLYNSRSVQPPTTGMSFDPNEFTISSDELSHAERQDMQGKLKKLSSMLDEVDQRYKQYYHQMQNVESLFDMVAGSGAAKPYTALALQTISRQFRCLHDAISRQIRVNRQRLGEKDDTPNGLLLPRLRYVDKQLRPPRTLQQLGVARHSWRPQRGLPESSVSVLRAWLFEHFLHPQTGLSRSQVANWFINARVRLWKPMVEDMYKEEFGDSEVDCRASLVHSAKAATDGSWASEDGGDELQGSGTYIAADGGHVYNNPDLIPDARNGGSARLGFQNEAHGDDDNFDCKVMNLQGNQRPNGDDDQTGDASLKTAAAAYDISVGGFAVGNQMSLALGLQRGEKDPLPSSGAMQLRGDDLSFFCGA
ncbi:hypothetical protein RJ639_013061 [Escallonia herrerae]|uniref:Uncharacterized protein n=1 Tax=Escallonia herrerae TaxID=1293975 RepID=A0AA89AMI3_9ASTE|nr:hypothetical protein RJ639_013061 [Escallonia herrerae]